MTVNDATAGQSYIVKVGTGSTPFTYENNTYVSRFLLAGNKGDAVNLSISGGVFGTTDKVVAVTLGDVCPVVATVPVSVQGTTVTTVARTVVAGTALAKTGFAISSLLAAGLMAIGGGIATLGLFQAAEKRRLTA